MRSEHTEKTILVFSEICSCFLNLVFLVFSVLLETKKKREINVFSVFFLFFKTQQFGARIQEAFCFFYAFLLYYSQCTNDMFFITFFSIADPVKKTVFCLVPIF